MDNTVRDDTKEQLVYLARIEALAEEILVDRQEIVKLDERRNNIRVAAREIKHSAQHKFWVQIGTSLMNVRREKAMSILQKDKESIDSDINVLQKNLKLKVNNLRELEHKSPVAGLMLNPLSHTEISVLKRNL